MTNFTDTTAPRTNRLHPRHPGRIRAAWCVGIAAILLMIAVATWDAYGYAYTVPATGEQCVGVDLASFGHGSPTVCLIWAEG